MKRRPHRSFRLTRRRDYTRSLALPGYISFTRSVNRSIGDHKKVFLTMAVVYGIAILLLGGIANQEFYTQINALLKDSSGQLFGEGIGQVGQAGLLLASVFVGGGTTLSTDQQIYLGFLLVMVWLTTVWLLREFSLGRQPKLRDGLYNAGAPIVASIAIILVALIQLMPLAITGLVYSGLTSAGLAVSGFGSMLFWVIAAIVFALTLYWLTSSFLALIIVTLPGMYPMRALRIAGDIVVGRRLRILYRLLWAALLIVLAWVVLLVPLVVLTSLLADVWEWLDVVPIMPTAVAFVSAFSTVWAASYIYLLYRRIVDDNAKPA